MDDQAAYEPRYLAGLLLFNRGDYFEAHEVWEDLWMETAGTDKTFYQGLIQAAVGLCHFCNGNVRGAVKLYHSSRDYLTKFGAAHLGLDLDDFHRQMAACFGELLANPEPTRAIEPSAEHLPVLALTPPPAAWPDLDVYVHDDNEHPEP